MNFTAFYVFKKCNNKSEQGLKKALVLKLPVTLIKFFHISIVAGSSIWISDIFQLTPFINHQTYIL